MVFQICCCWFSVTVGVVCWGEPYEKQRWHEEMLPPVEIEKPWNKVYEEIEWNFTESAYGFIHQWWPSRQEEKKPVSNSSAGMNARGLRSRNQKSKILQLQIFQLCPLPPKGYLQEQKLPETCGWHWMKTLVCSSVRRSYSLCKIADKWLWRLLHQMDRLEWLQWPEMGACLIGASLFSPSEGGDLPDLAIEIRWREGGMPRNTGKLVGNGLDPGD